MKAKSTGVLIGALHVGAGAAMVRGAFLLHPAAGWLALALCVLAAAGWLAGAVDGKRVSVGVRVDPSVDPSETPEDAARKMAKGAQILNRSGVRLHVPGRTDH